MSELTRREFLQYSGQLAGAVAASAVATQLEPLTALAQTATESEQRKPQTAGDVLSLPKGGGAIQGIGETFQADLFTGTGNFSVPIAVSPGRAGFGPQLTLQYSTGNGNGPFGLGWQLSIPRVTRKTEKGLPRYRDCGPVADGAEDALADCDVFVLSGAEDLVPSMRLANKNGNQQWEVVTSQREGYTITRYRPRTEGLFALIEKWQNGADVHWRATTRENVTSIYGRTSRARIFDPDPKKQYHIFEWLLEETFDDKGNHILYEYIQEAPGLSINGIYEQNRHYTSQRYIRRILYGNTPQKNLPNNQQVGPQRGEQHYVFEVLFDYGDLAADPADTYQAASSSGETFATGLDPRLDPFSTYRAGFEVRTLRRCKRVLMFHHFAELADGATKPPTTLVKSTGFEYAHNDDTQVSLLTSVTVTGYRWDQADKAYKQASLPPLTFTYSEFNPHEQHYQSLTGEGNQLPAVSLSDPNLELVDLNGNGLPDLLETRSGFYYWENLGNGHFDRRRTMAQMPAGLSLAQPGVHFADLGSDGRADLLVRNGAIQGIYETTPETTWETFIPLDNLPTVLDDPNVRLLDLTGDGLSDPLVTEDTAFVWYRALGEEGYAPAARIPRRYDREIFPDVSFADPSGRIRLADMNGDGLQDIVEVHDGGVDYWPNLGYGQFGARVRMANAPHYDYGFDPARLFLTDVDGSGCVDLVYVDNHQLHFWFNRSGNAWSGKETINGTVVNNRTSIRFADIFGNGTSCLLWSTDLSRRLGRNYKVLDFCGGAKPYLLTAINNNMGATTRVTYGSSTQHWLQDKREGEPWATPLPFPVQVVDKVEVIDHISRTKLMTTYRYHHGYFDGQEREFRGFGRVDQLDTETFDNFSQTGSHEAETAFKNVNRAFHVPLVLTKNWYHTGAYLEEEALTARYRREYWHEDDDHAPPPADHDAPASREGHRALRGSLLRSEVYALDGSARAQHPYTVSEQRYQVRTVQARELRLPGQPTITLPHGVFLTIPLETITYHYERRLQDPRIAHALTLEVDDFGNVRKTVAIGYGRREPDQNLPSPTDREQQTKALITYTENDFTIAIDDDAGNYRTPLPCETCTYELTGITPAKSPDRFTLEEWTRDDFALLRGCAEIPYEAYDKDASQTAAQKRLIEQVRTLYRPDNLGAANNNDSLTLLPLGQVESLALPGESYKLAFTPGLIEDVFKRNDEPLMPNPAAVLGGAGPDRGGYVASQTLKEAGLFPGSDLDNHWWVPSGRTFLSPNPDDSPQAELAYAQSHFFLPLRTRDPFHTKEVSTESTVRYDSYDLLPVKSCDALGNCITAGERDVVGDITKPGNDYRVLQPWLIMDPNGNRTAVAFDVLGMVVGTAVMGKPDVVQGDSLEGFEPEPAQLLDNFYAAKDPHAFAPDLLKGATTRIVYNLNHFKDTQAQYPDEPEKWQPVYAATLVRETHLHQPGGDQSKIQISFAYSDGFGREIQQKIQAEPGPIVDDGPIIESRWVGSGWTIFNNKGKPVRQFEPFFSQLPEKRHQFEFGKAVGVSPVLFYDPLGRVVATLHPNHTYEKVLFDPWQQTTHDVNDTCAPRNTQTGDPRTDSDIEALVAEYFNALPVDSDEPWQSWHEQRISGQLGPHEEAAANRAAAHADTPTTVHLDTLGRPFLTVARNRVVCADHALDGTEENFHTRVELDIEGNQRKVRDAIKQAWNEEGNEAEDELGRVVMQYAYDMLGNRIYQISMEAGARWMLNDVAGQPIRAWYSRSFTRRLTYDALRRPTGLYVTEKGVERLAERTIYGEIQGAAQNHRTRVYQLYDGAGIVTNVAYDFKGNLLESRRALLPDYWTAVDWQQNPLASDGSFTSSTTFDALNRPISVTAPDGSVHHPCYNEANLLDSVAVNLRGESTATPFVDNIDYNAKGQRVRIAYSNGTITTYTYDPLTFRLTQMKTTRPVGLNGLSQSLFVDPTVVQDLRYTYDPVGNICHIEDAALTSLTHNGEAVEPRGDYTYDAIYRLIEARGREHIGQTAFDLAPNDGNRRDHPFIGHRAHPNDPKAMRTYSERYEYDAVGNFKTMRHTAKEGNWTRSYDYAEESLIEAGKKSNRLTSTQLGNGLNHIERYGYLDDEGNDAHGSITAINTMQMDWDFKDQLQRVDLCGGGTAYYVYDAGGQRVRKVIDQQNGTKQKERIYLGGFELYCEYDGTISTVPTLERETLHIMDDKQRIALVETRNEVSDGTAKPLIRYQIGNHLSSASLELDEQGEIISYEEYFPYGSTSYQAVNKDIKATAKRYRYTGKERDEESGLYYYGARYYVPWLGRWTACDKFDNINRYLFVHARPSIAFDIGGLASNRQLMGLDEVSVSAALQKDPSLSNILKLTAKKTAYDLWNVVTAGFVSKHDALFEARSQGKISETEYWTKTTGEASKSLLVATVSAATGGTAGSGAKTLIGAVGRGAASGAVSGAAIDVMGQTIDIALENREEFDLKQVVVSGGTGAVFGAISGAVGRAGKTPQDSADDALNSTFTGGQGEGVYQTTSRLARGNLGERLAADALADQGHTILSYKPSIMGTNQGGIDIVTVRDGVLHLIDNKALTRAGNVSSVSALTTNFQQNLQTVRQEFVSALQTPGISNAERVLWQQAIDSIDSGNYIRAITNANVAPNNSILSGVTTNLQNLGIQFINVF